MSGFLSDLKQQIESDSTWESESQSNKVSGGNIPRPLSADGSCSQPMLSPTELDSGPSTTPAIQSANTLDASVSVWQQGVTYNINASGSANVNLQYGANIGYQNSNANSGVLQNMMRSRNAEYDMTDAIVRGPCTPQTRTAILETLVEWSKSEAAQLYWLTGIAGTGKTTITYSFCDKMKAEGRLAATFFCSRSVDDCRDIKLIIPTIAYQLAREYPALNDPLVKLLAGDPELLKRRLEVQLQKLIIKLWNDHAGELPANAVVVLDALDECDGGYASFLTVIFDHAAQLPFKILIASRPEFSVRDTMKAKDESILSTFILHEVQEDLVQADIARYLEVMLAARVPSDVLDTLKEISGSLFIVAATLVRLFSGANIDPHERLEHFKTSWATQRTDQESLDDFYRGVLSSILQDRKLLDKEVEGIQNVLFTVVCARDPLTQESLAQLLGVKDDEIVRRLDSLHSILSIPQIHNKPITVLHASIADFIQDPERSQEFWYHPTSFNLKMAKWCLNLMNSHLHQNPCGLSVQESDKRIAFAIPTSQISTGIRYAVIYWGEHWSLSDLSESETAEDLLHKLITTKLLQWLEHLVLLQKLPISIQSLELVLSRLGMRGGNKTEVSRPGVLQRFVALFTTSTTNPIVEDENPEIGTLVYDALRFVQLIYEAIKNNPFQVYSSALAWIPERSPLRYHYGFPNTVPRILYGLDESWTGPDRLIDSISTADYSPIVISPDGGQVIYVSRDETIRFWSLHNQREESVLNLRTYSYSPLSFTISGDGSHIVTKHWGGKIWMWHATTSQVLFTLETTPATSVSISSESISSDNKYLATAHVDGSIRIWDQAGNLIRSFEDGGTGKYGAYGVWAICFMPNTTYIVTNSEGETARIWNTLTGEVEATLRGHTNAASCVACSPVDTITVTGSIDLTARIWNLSGKTLHVLRGHSGYIRAVAFMPDGKRVVSGSEDKTLRVWDVATGAAVQLIATAHKVGSIAVFPDGMKIASLSNHTISIWSIRGGGLERKEKRANVEAKSIVFSSNGQMMLLLPSLRILDTVTLEEKAVIRSRGDTSGIGALSDSGRRVAVSEYNKINMWEVGKSTVESRHTFEGHRGGIEHISFSSDEQRLVSASNDGAALVWNVETGQQIHVLRHPQRGPDSPEVLFATFSQDGSKVGTSMFHPSALCIWDTQTGDSEPEPVHGHLVDPWDGGPVKSIQFTPDDQHFITQVCGTVTIWDSQSYKQIHEYKGYNDWRVLDNGSSYAFNGRWICHIAHLGDKPRKVLWVPPQYRPNLTFSGPLFTTSPQGIHVCLPREDRFVSLIIPHH